MDYQGREGEEERRERKMHPIRSVVRRILRGTIDGEKWTQLVHDNQV